MKPVALITDVQTPLGEELVRAYLARGYGVAAARSAPQGKESSLASADEDFFLVDWNRSSPVSARNLLLSSLNRFQRLDEALLLMCPAVERSLLPELGYAAVEQAVDAWTKGSLFLLKALLEYFEKRVSAAKATARSAGEHGALPHAGVLALIDVTDQEPDTVFPPLEAALRGAFRATVRSLFATAGRTPVHLHGFEAHAAPARELASFIVETLETRGSKSTAKWHRPPGKAGIFGGLRTPR